MFRLGEEPSENLSASTTAEERIAMVWELTVEAYTLAGYDVGPRPRSEWPIRVVRLGQTSDEESET